MNGFDLFPKDGRVVVTSPENAIRLFDKVTPTLRNRIFAAKGVEPNVAYVIDVSQVMRGLS